MSKSTRQRNALSIVQTATGIGILVFWLLFFTVGITPAQPPPCYLAFEHAFPLPDVILAIALLTSVANLIQGGNWGLRLSLGCAGGLLFLDLVDFRVRAENGAFRGSIIDGLQSLIIPLWCVAAGLWIFAFTPRYDTER